MTAWKRAYTRINCLSLLMDTGYSAWFKVKYRIYRGHKCNSKERLAAKIVQRYWELVLEQAIEDGGLSEVYGTNARLFVGGHHKAKTRNWWMGNPEMLFKRVQKPTMWMVFVKKGFLKRRVVLLPKTMYGRMFDLAIQGDHFSEYDFFNNWKLFKDEVKR